LLFWLLTLLNSAPLYAPLCAVLRPRRAPGGVALSLVASDAPGATLREPSTLAMVARYTPGAPLDAEFGDEEEEEETEGKEDEEDEGVVGKRNAGSKDPAPPLVTWFALESVPAPALAALLAPLAEAARVVCRRVGPGAVARAALLGDPLPLLRARDLAGDDEGDGKDGGIARWTRDLLSAADSALRSAVGLEDE